MRKYLLIACAISLVAGMLTTTGCQTATPSKAQIAEINADVINVHGGGTPFCELLNGYTNLPPDQFVLVVDSLTSLAAATECNVISQAMTNETGGDESNSQTASGPSTPIEVKYDQQGSGGLLGEVVGEVYDKVSGPGGDGNAGSAAAVVDPNCPDGNCSDPAPK